MRPLLAALSFVLLAATQQPPIEQHIRALSTDAMEGRGLGTKGLEQAAAYIEKELRAAKLEPAFGKSYRQQFPVKMGVALGTNNRIEGLSADEWTPLGFSSPGAFEGKVAFVGYGIEAGPLNYRELEGIDLKGKVALMLRYEPQERDDQSPFDPRVVRGKAGRLQQHRRGSLILIGPRRCGPRRVADVSAERFTRAAAHYFPSRDVALLEYMELLAVFEASSRRLLPPKYASVTPEELDLRLRALRAVGGRR
ncbi:MAG TPA: hypothetical protein VEO54_30965 [Thermoanaerobaculia bacterium]|nr:hypothetical protein [Thermoanaerobaculia bacterium]